MVTQNETDCALLAGRHHGLSEGIRGLLETVFDVVVMVADETSLLESAKRLSASLAVVDMSLAREDGFGLLRRLRELCPTLKQIVISAHDENSVSQSALAAGADGFVLQTNHRNRSSARCGCSARRTTIRITGGFDKDRLSSQLAQLGLSRHNEVNHEAPSSQFNTLSCGISRVCTFRIAAASNKLAG
jgi:DNA-binding NarL/FixJ family response regulator